MATLLDQAVMVFESLHLNQDLCKTDIDRGSLKGDQEIGHQIQVRNVCSDPRVRSRKVEIIESKGADLLSHSEVKTGPTSQHNTYILPKNYKVDAYPTGSLNGNEEASYLVANGAVRIGSIKVEMKKAATQKLQDTYTPPGRYKMNANPRGICLLLINHVFMHADGTQSHRAGSLKDRERLEASFKRLGFTVYVTENLDAEHLEKVALKYAMMDHSPFDCFVCYMGTHGYEDHVSGVHFGGVEINKILSFFSAHNCKTLAGKPKLFFIDACRGNSDLPKSGAPVKETVTYLPGEQTVTIPNLTDFFVGYSTLYKCVSYNDSQRGSFYAEALTEVLNEYGDRDEINTLLTRVNSKVSNTAMTGEDGKTETRQIPTLQNQLRKQLYIPRLG